MTNAEQNELGQDPSRSLTPSSRDMAWLLVAAGLVWALVLTIRGQRGLKDWLVPVGLAGGGVAILVKQRRARIGEAEQSIMAELDGLDPVAKAQVLKAVAEQQLNIQKS
jgi:hypothetical protein